VQRPQFLRASEILLRKKRESGVTGKEVQGRKERGLEPSSRYLR